MPGKFVVNPRYDLRNNVPDATVGYKCKETSLKMDVQEQRFSLSHLFGRNKRNEIAPTLSIRTGDFSVTYCRDLPLTRGFLSTTVKPVNKDFSVIYNRGKATTTFKPNDSIALQWSDGGWDAIICAPLEGYFPNSGVKFSMKRNIGVSLI